MSTTQPGIDRPGIDRPGMDRNDVRRALSRAAQLLDLAEVEFAAERSFTLVEFNAILDRVCLDAVRLPRSDFKDVREQLRSLLDRLEILRGEVARAAKAA
jgi:hypothetical protein